MRRKRCTRSFVLFILMAHLIPNSLEFRNVSQSRSSRAIDGDNKYLIFPQGSNVQLVYCLTIGTYAKPESFFTMGVTAGLAYELPYIKTVPYRKPAEVYHRRSRRDLYHKLELMLNTRHSCVEGPTNKVLTLLRQGKDGRACILKALCQAGKRNSMMMADRRPFLEEILHSIFTFPTYDGSDTEENEETHNQNLWNVGYDKAYNTQDDCDKVFASCTSFF